MGRGSTAGRGWSLEGFERTEQTVAELVAFHAPDGSAQTRLRYVFTQIDALRGHRSALKQLQLLVFALHALGIHVTAGGLGERTVAGLLKIADDLTRLHGIDPSTSRLGGIVAKLYAVRSALAVRDGLSFDAMWHAAVAQHFLDSRAPVVAQEAITRSLAALRMGAADHALSLLAAASGEAAAVPLRATALRWLGRMEEARAAVAPLGPWSWPVLFLDAAASGNPSRLARALNKHGALYEATYALEAFLYIKASSSSKSLDEFPKIATLAKDRKLGIKRSQPLARCALALETCYDTTLPLVQRILTLKAALDCVPSVATLDQEMLVLAAAARWLARVRAQELASVLLRRYRAHSLTVSLGAHADVLGVAHDLMAKVWFECAAGL